MRSDNRNRVVITGIGIICPVGLNRYESWDNLIAGYSGIDAISAFDTKGLETTIAGEVKGFDGAQYLGRKEARHTDRFVQLAIGAAIEAVEQAQLVIDETNRHSVGVSISSGIGGIITLEDQVQILASKGARRVNPFLIPMMLPDMASGRVSMYFGAKGPNFSVVSACSSSADGLGQALDMLRIGRVDIVITGGAEAAITPIGIAGFNSCKALSKQNMFPQKASRPFDAKRDGFVLGEGASVLVIETLQSAINRGVEPIAEVIGYGSTADAYHVTQPAPGGEGGARAMTIALDDARIQALDVDYVNAHGTSTQLNDKFETMAMKSVFKEEAYLVPISSTKSMTGHLLGACGALEASVSIMAISNAVLPPTINLEFPDIQCDLDYTPHLPRRGRIEVAMSNSFGFGGHNASLIFKQFDELEVPANSG